MTDPTATPASETHTYVLDTCVLLADPEALVRFDEHDVVLPLVVVEELDRKKTAGDQVGRNARAALRLVEELRLANGGRLTTAAPIPGTGGGTLRIEQNFVDVGLPAYLDPRTPDHRILAVARGLGATLVTKDAALRIKGSAIDVVVEDYKADTVHVDHHDTGVLELEVPVTVVDALHRDGKAFLSSDVLAAGQPDGDESRHDAAHQAPHHNLCVVLHAGPSSALGRVVELEPDGVTLQRVRGDRGAFGRLPRDVRQTFAIDLLLDPDVPCVSLMGMAGTGKTFLALAAGLQQVLETQAYRRMSVYRPLVAVGRQEVGYLPGDLDEKLSPWMAAVHDNLYALLRREGRARTPAEHRQVQSTIDAMVDRGQLELAAITYLRGRSITEELVVVDEAQNIELSALKVVLTRIASGSKVVFCGDLGQIDNPYISPFGGMATLIERMKPSRLFGHVTLSKGVRSELAEFAAVAL